MLVVSVSHERYTVFFGSVMNPVACGRFFFRSTENQRRKLYDTLAKTRSCCFYLALQKKNVRCKVKPFHASWAEILKCVHSFRLAKTMIASEIDCEMDFV